MWLASVVVGVPVTALCGSSVIECSDPAGPLSFGSPRLSLSLDPTPSPSPSSSPDSSGSPSPTSSAAVTPTPVAVSSSVAATADPSAQPVVSPSPAVSTVQVWSEADSIRLAHIEQGCQDLVLAAVLGVLCLAAIMASQWGRP